MFPKVDLYIIYETSMHNAICMYYQDGKIIPSIISNVTVPSHNISFVPRIIHFQNMVKSSSNYIAFKEKLEVIKFNVAVCCRRISEISPKISTFSYQVTKTFPKINFPLLFANSHNNVAVIEQLNFLFTNDILSATTS